MSESVLIGRRVVMVAAVLAALSGTPQAATVFPALERAALQVKAPERQVLLAAAQAGSRLVAFGERGLVVLSDDAGQTWRQARQVPVSATLTAAAFATDKLGWAIGHGGVILNTRDGGETWTKQADGVKLAQLALQAADAEVKANPDNPAAVRAQQDAQTLVDDGPDKPLLDVYFQDARHGWVVGAYNLFFETTDGGASWQSVSRRLHNPKALHLYAIRAQGESVFIVGEQGQMHRSLDGGRSFEAVTSPYKGSWFTLALPGQGSVVAAGLRGNAFRSFDLGQTWQAIEGVPPVSFVSATALADGRVLLANQGGQLFVSQSGSTLIPVGTVPMPLLSGVLLLKDKSILALGMGGAMRQPAPALNGASK